MPLLVIIGGMLTVWIAAEVCNVKVAYRIALGAVLVCSVGTAAWAVGGLFQRWQSTFDSNAMVKKLSSGLVVIVAERDLDRDELGQALRGLDESIVITYEGSRSTERAIREFLKKHGISYEKDVSPGRRATDRP